MTKQAAASVAPDEAPVPARDFHPPHPVQLKPSRMGAWALRRLGWTVEFEGMPTKQGVAIVYPHTSNWDFWVAITAKWAIGVPVGFWGKDTLFKIPLFGRWLRSLGGMPVDRTSSKGAVGDMVDHIREMKARDAWYWLALSPEGTRKWIPGWRTGFYQVAVRADVPVLLAHLDWGKRTLRATDFIRLSGDVEADMARIAASYRGVLGHSPGSMAPIQMVDAKVSRADLIVK